MVNHFISLVRGVRWEPPPAPSSPELALVRLTAGLTAVLSSLHCSAESFLVFLLTPCSHTYMIKKFIYGIWKSSAFFSILRINLIFIKICMFLGSISSWEKVLKFSYSRSKPSKIILNYIFHLCKTELLFTIKNTNKMALLITTTTAENSVRRQFASPCWPRYLNNSNQVLILLVPTNLRCFW